MHLDDSSLNEYLDGRLEAEPARQARQHLSVCQECRARRDRLQSLTASLAMLAEVPLRRDLVRPVLARLGPKPAPAFLGWVTGFEAVGATALATYLWPRLAEAVTPVVNTVVPAAATLWSATVVSGLEDVWAQLALEIRSLAYASDLWLRPLTIGSGTTWPLVLALGTVAFLLGVLGNGVLLRSPLRRV
jgi:anti-sigma factor RsiW